MGNAKFCAFRGERLGWTLSECGRKEAQGRKNGFIHGMVNVSVSRGVCTGLPTAVSSSAAIFRSSPPRRSHADASWKEAAISGTKANQKEESQGFLVLCAEKFNHLMAPRETSTVLSDVDEAQVGNLWSGNSAQEAADPQERSGVAPSAGEKR